MSVERKVELFLCNNYNGVDSLKKYIVSLKKKDQRVNNQIFLVSTCVSFYSHLQPDLGITQRLLLPWEQEEGMKKCCRIVDIFSNSNLKMLADGHNICKGAELQLIPTLNKLSGFTEGKTSKVNLGEANRKRI